MQGEHTKEEQGDRSEIEASSEFRASQTHEKQPELMSSKPDLEKNAGKNDGATVPGHHDHTLLSRDDEEQDRSDLLDQFYATLRAIYFAVRQDEDHQSSSAEINNKIEELFSISPSWRAAYEIEQLLSLVMTEEQLDAELARRLEEAKTLKLTYVDVLQEQYKIAVGKENVKTKRFVLQRLLNDLQWFYAQRIKRRAVSKKLAIRVSTLFLIAFVLFFLVLFFQFFARPSLPYDGSANAAASIHIAVHTKSYEITKANGESDE